MQYVTLNGIEMIQDGIHVLSMKLLTMPLTQFGILLNECTKFVMDVDWISSHRWKTSSWLVMHD